MILVVPYVGIFLLPVVVLLEDIFIFGNERRCLHDMLSGTRVIVAPPCD